MRLIIGATIVCAVALALPSRPAPDEPMGRDGLPQQFRVATGGDPLIVPVTILGKQYSFVVDTGCSHTLYDTSMKHLLGPRVDTVVGESPNARVMLERYWAPAAYLGTLPLPSEHPVLVADLGSSRRMMEIDIDGLLGMDFLRNYVVRIDFDGGVLTFYDIIEHEQGQMLPLHSGHIINVPYIDADVCGCVQRFEIDTGAIWTGDGELGHRFFDELERLGKVQPSYTMQLNAIGSHRAAPLGPLSTLKVGRFEHRSLFVSSSLRNRLGLDYCSRYNVTFDFPRQRLYLRKSKHFDRPPRFWWSGLHFSRSTGEVRVSRVEPGRPAEEAGIRKDDVIVSVAGLPAARTRLFALRRSLYGRRTSVPITLERNGQPFSVLLNPRQHNPAEAR
jgi:hypothetical protein